MEPSEIVVGDYIQWKRSDLVSDYPTADYTATYIARITGGGASEIQLTGTAYNGSYLFTVDSTTSADFNPGYYHWQLEIVRNSDSNRIVVDRGAFTAIVDLDVNNADPRTHAENHAYQNRGIAPGQSRFGRRELLNPRAISYKVQHCRIAESGVIIIERKSKSRNDSKKSSSGDLCRPL